LLVEKFEPTIVNHQFVKKSLLIAGANAGIPNDGRKDPRRFRINVLVVGDPSQAKSTMIKKICSLIPNGRFESAQGSSGVGLTFTITKEPSESYVLRLGAIPLASGSICGINEMNQMPLEQQKHFFDFMEEGESTNNKYAIPARIVGHTSLVASANPRNGRWNDPNSIQLDEINILTQIIEKFDIICIVRETQGNKQLDREYINKLNQVRNNIKAGIYDGYDDHLKKYLMYARTFNPNGEMSEEALNMINEYWINMGANENITGRNRKLESLKRIAIAISKVKLKNEVDTEDATDTMKLYNTALMHFSQIVPVSQSPKEVTYDMYINILREMSPNRIALTELKDIICDKNEQIRSYLGHDPNTRSNKKLRMVYDELLNNEHVSVVKQKPIVLMWKGKDKDKDAKTPKNIVKSPKSVCDPCDLPPFRGSQKEEKQETGQAQNGLWSHRAHRSHSNLLYRCYYCAKNGNGNRNAKGSKVFETHDEKEYLRHGDLKHRNKPMFPNQATMEKHGLTPQGKSWEVY
jgi:DNA replicative helicase MCM subunit Mcm2 (Cdc46/Mcm family)